METSEQARTVGPHANGISDPAKLRRKKWLKYLGYLAILLTVEAIVVVILFLTILRVYTPTVTLDAVRIENFPAINGTDFPPPGTNITLVSDFTVRNRNFGAFNFPARNTTIYYYNTQIAQSLGPRGSARSRNSRSISTTVDIPLDQLAAQRQNLVSDLGSGRIVFGSSTRFRGRVRIFIIINRRVTASTNCLITVDVASRAVVNHDCNPTIRF